MSRNRLSINGENFILQDELDNIAVVDSFVKRNKIWRGHGEARLYVGQQRTLDFNVFFDNFTGESFFLRKDLQKYLEDAKFEYENQEQGYRTDISGYWQENLDELRGYSEKISFSLENATGAEDTSRFYIRSQDDIFRGYFRKIALPIITYVAILKLKDSTGNNSFYFRPSLDYFYNPYYHPAVIKKEETAIEEETITESEKVQIIKSRIGQGKFREKLLIESSECVITRVNDERILTASHIKPWSVSENSERLDHYNGLVLTPTYDRLFDQGFISFTDESEILISPYISPLNIKKLGLGPNRKYIIPEINKRKKYLEYHRTNIFKK